MIDNRKTAVVSLRVHPMDALIIRLIADYCGESPSEFLRNSALDRVKKDTMPALYGFMRFHPETRGNPELAAELKKRIEGLSDGRKVAHEPERNEGGEGRKEITLAGPSGRSKGLDKGRGAKE